jgi:hypothetical protein
MEVHVISCDLFFGSCYFVDHVLGFGCGSAALCNLRNLGTTFLLSPQFDTTVLPFYHPGGPSGNPTAKR